jgi:hypothetical protein
MRLRSPGDIDGAIDAANMISNQLYNTRSGTAASRRDEWPRWRDIADRQLRSPCSVMASPDIPAIKMPRIGGYRLSNGTVPEPGGQPTARILRR